MSRRIGAWSMPSSIQCFAAHLETEASVPFDQIGLGTQDDRRWRQLDRATNERTRVAVTACRGERGNASDATSILAVVEQTQRAHHLAVMVDPEMQGRRLQVARVDVGVHAVLFHDEDVLADGENPQQRLRGQLLEQRDVDLSQRSAGTQGVACGATTVVQNEQRVAALGIMLRHSGHARVVDSSGLAIRACILACIRLYGSTKKK